MFQRRQVHLSAIMMLTLVAAASTGPCVAQYVSYPGEYRVLNTYPALSYLADQPVNSGHSPVVSSTVHSRLSTPASRPATGLHTRPTTHSPGDVPARSLIRMAGADTHRRDRYPLDDSLGRRQPVQSAPTYGLTAIQSARNSAAQFRMIGQSAAPLTQKVANDNAAFADQWADLAEAHNALTKRVNDADEQLAATTGDFDDVSAKLARYGLTPTIGLLLRHKKEQLDGWQVYDWQTHDASQELIRSRQAQLALEMIRYDGSDPRGQTDQMLAAADLDPARAEDAAVASQIQRLLSQRRQWLDALAKGYHEYQQKLSQLDSATTAAATLTDKYRKLIDRHITWIRSGDPIGISDLRDLKGGLSALFDARRSQDFGPTLERKLKSESVTSVGLLAWVMLALLVRWRAKSWLVGIGNGKRMRKVSADWRKVTASALTSVVALALPGILYAIALYLGSGVVSESTLHASGAFYAASLVALVVELPRQLLRRHGFLDRHVTIELPGRKRAMHFMTLVGLGLVVAAYTVTLMGSIDRGMWRDSVARFGFMTAMLVVTAAVHRALRPTGGFLEPMIARYGGAVIHRARLVIYLAGIGFPLAMIALSALGYGFTANELVKRAILTLCSILIAATLWSGIKILSARAWQSLTGTAPPPRQFDEYGEIESKPEAITGKLAQHNLELKHQLAFLCQCALVIGAIACFGWLWIDMLPNARMGNPVVWTVQDTVTQSSEDGTGQVVTRRVVQSTPITALHLLLAAATLFVAFQLAKLLPALFDVLVLQRVSFDEGMEHFSLVLGRCLLFGVGCLIACKWIGVRWSTIQWLAVGLTIGLGFGLQDVVRNLLGGMIVLFEKPARLGDLITVGKITGRVSSQRLRTTVLSDEDGREVIIPNKKFVSDDVVNWMGAGRLRVIPIEVAVKRDRRPADVCRTIQELVMDQKHVLLAPAPQATLVCISQASQRIEVRAWVEQQHDAVRFRDGLLKVVRKFLSEQHLLSDNQPPQPTMPDADELSGGSYPSLTAPRRRRPA